MTPGYTGGAVGLVSGRGCARPSFVVAVVFGATGGLLMAAFAFLAGGASFLVAFPFILDDGLGAVVATLVLPFKSDGVVAAVILLVASCSVDDGGSWLEELGMSAEAIGLFASGGVFVEVMDGSIGGDSIETDVVSKLALLSFFIPSP